MASKKNVELSVVLPCYNEEKNLELLLERYAQAAPHYAWELVLVDNGSTDHTARTLKKLLAQKRYRFARSVKVAVNQGYGHGIFTGLKACRARFLAYSHADMQCDAADVFKAYGLLKSQAAPESTLAKGRRLKREWGPSVVTGLMSLLARLVLWQPLSDINAQPKVFPSHLLDKLSLDPLGFEFDLYVMHQALSAGMKVVTLPVVFGKRAFGVSKWAATFLSRWKTMLKVAAFIFKLRFL